MTAPVVAPVGSPEPAAPSTSGFGPMATAGVASIGAGVVHLAAMGPHADVPQAAATFAALGLVQLAWGAAALTARRRAVAGAGLLLQTVAVGGWVLAKTTGIGWIDGLGAPEALQWADVVAALLALVAAAVTGRLLLAGEVARAPSARRLGGVAAAVLSIALLGAVTSPGHQHDHSHGDGPIGHAHAARVVPPVTYDPGAIDLSGVPGVTLGERTRAERLVREAVAAAPRWTDRRRAADEGFLPADLGAEGVEQVIRWEALTDEHVADPEHPEGLVYEIGPGDRRTLVALVLLLAPGTLVADAPDLGGALAPWRPEDHVCVSGTGDQRRVAGLAAADGSCPAGDEPVGAMLRQQVWVVPHRCGPFAGLDDVDARLERASATACATGT